MNKIIIGSITAATILLAVACGNKKSNQNESSDTPAVSSTTFKNVDNTVAEQINAVFQHYFHLKNGLVAADQNEAKAGAQGILSTINAVDVSKLTAEQKTIFDTQTGIIKENAQHIAETGDIKHQREHLGGLTNGVYALAKAFGGEKTLYYDYCPMANADKGGYWLSEKEEISNPYFGDEMLNCGETKEIIKR